MAHAFEATERVESCADTQQVLAVESFDVSCSTSCSQMAATSTHVASTGRALTINGKVFPGTEPLVVKTGKRVRIRIGNRCRHISPWHRPCAERVGLRQQVELRTARRWPSP
jgi:hypothetical protein